MDFQQKIQLAMKQVFTDIKRINPVTSVDGKGNIWFQGEKIGDLTPNLVLLIDRDQNPDNGGEEIRFYHTTYSRPGEKTQVRLFLEDGALVRELVDDNGGKKRSVVSNRVSDLHFLKNPDDILDIRVRMIITDDRNPDLKETLVFAVHLDTDLVCVQMKTPAEVD